MNGKKSKQLRKECLDIPKMKRKHPFPIYEFVKDIFGKVTRQRTGIEVRNKPVNHYRNAKKLYKGDVRQAVQAAITKAQNLELRKVYSY